MGLLEFRKYTEEKCPECGGKMFYLQNDLLMVKLSQKTATVTLHCEKCSHTEQKEIQIK